VSQNDEEAVLKSARFLYKSGYTDEAKAVLTKLNTEPAKALLAKMGGAGKIKMSKNSSLSWPGIIAGYIVLGLLAFGLGWMLAPKTQEAILLESVNQELQAENNPDRTATIESFQATREAIQDSNEMAMTQISASQTAAIEAATATAGAQGQ
jgi:hypothetical protein